MRQAFLVALVGCGALFGKGPHVPGMYQGAIEVTVRNTTDRPMCAFLLWQDGGAQDNWLGDDNKIQPIAPGASHSYFVAPGVYHFLGGICDGDHVIGSYGTYGTQTRRIRGKTSIAMGPKRFVGAQMWFGHLYTGPQAPVEQGGPVEEAPMEEPAAEEPASSSSSSSSSPSSEPSAPSGPRCMVHGEAGCNDENRCCAGLTCASRNRFSDGSLGNGYCQ